MTKRQRNQLACTAIAFALAIGVMTPIVLEMVANDWRTLFVVTLTPILTIVLAAMVIETRAAFKAGRSGRTVRMESVADFLEALKDINHPVAVELSENTGRTITLQADGKDAHAVKLIRYLLACFEAGTLSVGVAQEILERAWFWVEFWGRFHLVNVAPKADVGDDADPGLYG